MYVWFQGSLPRGLKRTGGRVQQRPAEKGVLRFLEVGGRGRGRGDPEMFRIYLSKCYLL